MSHTGHFERQLGNSGIDDVKFASDGRQLVTYNICARVAIWIPQSGELVFQHDFGMEYPRSVTLSNGGLLAVAAHGYDDRGEIRVVRVADGTVVKSLQLRRPKKVRFASTRHDQTAEDLFFHQDEAPLFMISASSLSAV